MSNEKIQVPNLNEVSDKNREILNSIKEKAGFVPNIYATYALSENALERYTTIANGAQSLSQKEKEVINIVVSQVNGCRYCQSAHTAVGKMVGFSDEQILEMRKGSAKFDDKLNALVNLTRQISLKRGKVDDATLQNFFKAGYTQENLIDTVVNIGEKTTTNLLHKVTNVPIDFPEAPILEEEEAL